MSTGAFDVEDDEHGFCPQCYGKRWVTIQGRKMRCTCAIGDATTDPVSRDS
jgi:hypothetical protein